MQVKKVLDLLFTREEVTEMHTQLGIPLTTIKYNLTEQAKKLELKGIAIDTMSHLFDQDKRILEAVNKSGTLELQDWGKLERYYSGLLAILAKLPVWVIVTCHITYDKDQGGGGFYFAPKVSGATKDNLPQYFDCVFYTKTALASDGKRTFAWQTAPDNSRFAKDRLDVLPSKIYQDYREVFTAYTTAGISNPKILVIGESGTGKTRSLATINGIKEAVKKVA